ncbi:MAG: hypothetical protein ABIH11_01945 [Candidatus Altiarchaeota archaeon]
MRYLTSIALLTVFCLFLGCVAENTTDTSKTTVKKSNVQKRPSRSPQISEDLADFRDVRGGKDLKACDTIESEKLKDVCIRDVAVRLNNVRACDGIQTKTVRDICYYRIAVNKTDETTCKKIGDQKLRELCPEMIKSVKAVASGDTGACGKLESQARESCYFGIALNTKDASVCDKIVKKPMRDNCKEKIA